MWMPDPDLRRSALSLVVGEPNRTANLANIAAVIYHTLPDLNWAGFYLWDQAAGELVLGPFQGKPACLRIRPDRGVCGAAVRTREPQRVADVHSFPGHIACDAASRSELVIPLLAHGECVGVLDLDSPRVDRFSLHDQETLTTLMQELMPHLWPQKENL